MKNWVSGHGTSSNKSLQRCPDSPDHFYHAVDVSGYILNTMEKSHEKMDSDRGEDNNETDQSSRKKAEEILGNRHEEVQISCSVHIGYFI